MGNVASCFVLWYCMIHVPCAQNRLICYNARVYNSTVEEAGEVEEFIIGMNGDSSCNQLFLTS